LSINEERAFNDESASELVRTKTVAVDSMRVSPDKRENTPKIHQMREIKYPGEELAVKLSLKRIRNQPRKFIRQSSRQRNRIESLSNEALARHSFDMSLVLESLKNQNVGFSWQSFENQYYYYRSKSPQNIMLFGLVKPIQP